MALVGRCEISRLTILVFQYVIQPNLLSSGMLCTSTPDHGTNGRFQHLGRTKGFSENSLLQLLSDLLVNGITEIFHCTFPTLEHHGSGVVWRQASWFGVHTDQIKGFPHFFDELVDVKPLVGGNRNTVRDFVYKVEFLDGNHVDLVQDLDGHQTNQRRSGSVLT